MKWNLIRHWIAPLFGAMILVCGCVALMLGVVRGYHSPLPVDQPETRARQIQPPTLTAQAGAQSVIAVAQAPKMHLYECLTGGARIYSQQPCGANAKLREIDTSQMNTFQTKVYSVPNITESVAVSGPREIPDGSLDGSRCADIELAISQVEARLRHGYSVPEGNYLRAKLHELYDESYELKCGR